LRKRKICEQSLHSKGDSKMKEEFLREAKEKNLEQLRKTFRKKMQPIGTNNE